MSPGNRDIDDEIAEFDAAEYAWRCEVGYNGPPDRKRARKLAIEIAQARVDAALAAVLPNDKFLDARLLELADVLDGTIDPVEYTRPSPPPPLHRVVRALRKNGRSMSFDLRANMPEKHPDHMDVALACEPDEDTDR